MFTGCVTAAQCAQRLRASTNIAPAFFQVRLFKQQALLTTSWCCRFCKLAAGQHITASNATRSKSTQPQVAAPCSPSDRDTTNAA